MMSFHPSLTAWVCAGLLLVSGGCVGTSSSQDVGDIYDSVARAPDYQRNPVIVIPGLLGSRLVQQSSGREVWGTIDSREANPNDPENAALLAIPMVEGARLADLRDDVVSDGPLDRLKIRILGIPIHVSAYENILNTLGVGGYHDPSLANEASINENYNCFQFHFDWRRDISESVMLLHEFVLRQRAISQENYRRRFGIDNPDLKFDVVAHSMGSLILRYYLRYGPQPLPEDGTLPNLTWEGTRYIERAIMVAPPNQGSTLTLKELIAGSKFSSFLPIYPAAVLGTMPAVYQLLPRPRSGLIVQKDDHGKAIDISDPDVWEQLQWGLTSPDQDHLLQAMLPEVKGRESRVRIADEHRRKCLARAAQMHAALDIPATPPPSVQLHLFAGSSEPTSERMAIDMRTGDYEYIGTAAGDGTVTRTSAIMIEELPGRQPIPRIYPIAWTSKTFIPSNHLGLTSHPIFVDNVLSLLLESRDTADLAAIRSAYARQFGTADQPVQMVR
ncbi:MAG: hypothetical protein R3C05_20450 [Pirellulaceae bacterium]